MSEKSKFQQELFEARKALVRSKSALIEELDFAGKLREKVRRNPYLWVAGAGIGIFLLSRFFGGRAKNQRPSLQEETGGAAVIFQKNEEKKSKRFSLFGLLWKLGVFVFPIVRPKIEELVKSHLLPLVLKKVNDGK